MIELLPPRSPVVLARGAARPSANPRLAEELDALAILAPAHEPDLASLPHGDLLLAEHARRPRRAGATYAVTLPNRRRTRVRVGLLGADAGAFEALTLAGRLAREFAAERPGSVGLATLLPEAQAPGAMDALGAAMLAATQRVPTAAAAPEPPWAPGRIALYGPADPARLAAVEQGAGLVRWLTALPPNVLTPGAYRRAVRTLARRRGWRVREYDERALARAGCGAFLAVSQGSATRDAAIVHVAYRPKRAARGVAPIALVGKGLCFDTGGTNLKPQKSMLGMHTDMAGSAVALGILDALSALDFPRPVDAWLALAENRIGPGAYKPNDVVRAANGTTIEIVHTDAEGRLVLADTLALAARTNPACLIDFATLTGACVSALTERYSGVFTNRPRLREVLESAGAASGERVWGFPAPADFDEELESASADVLQCLSEGKGDHIYAARFLGRFVPAAIPWVHVDLSSAHRTGGLGHVASPLTGFGVRFGTTLLLDCLRQFEAAAGPVRATPPASRPRAPRRSSR
ncbi:MAG: M17 family metallopeptidase [Steroidobacteraceae bacterium]|nr:M17 family metallopeptidase [Steroidobacteraceae bacterium]